MNTRSSKTKNYVESFFKTFEQIGGDDNDIVGQREYTEEKYRQKEEPISFENNVPDYDNEETYTFEPTGEKYTLANESLLSKDIQFLEPGTTYTVRMCIYRAVLNGISPYLTYYTRKDTDENGNPVMKFPEYTFVYSSLSGEQEEDTEPQEEYNSGMEMEDNESDIMEKIELTQQLVDIFSFSICGDENCGKYFKGIYQTDIDKTNNIFYIVFDCTRVIDSGSKPELFSVVVYEILVSKKWGNIPFDSSVSRLFKEITDKNDSLDFHHLKTMDNEYVLSPYCLFMCSDKSDTIEEKEEEEEEKEEPVEEPLEEKEEQLVEELEGGSQTLYNIYKKDRELIAYPKINHEKLGYYTFFSSNPIDTTIIEQIEIRRFLLFIDPKKINFLPVEKTEMEKIENLYDYESEGGYKKHSCITFFEEDKQLWCVKSQDIFSEL